MKPRIKTDSTILVALVVLTILLLYKFPHLYTRNILVDDIQDFIGLCVALIGNFLRMTARGHKKKHSQSGEDLVTTGPYALVRNPMYLGTFLIGCGFAFIVWPLWSLPLFAFLFHWRFNIQIKIEEEHLSKIFGKKYQAYCERVPRLFPRLNELVQINFKKTFPLDEIWSTKEKRGLILWPVAAIFLDVIQEQFIYHTSCLEKTVLIFLVSMLLMGAIGWVLYRPEKGLKIV